MRVVQGIAEGNGFDIVPAIRYLAQQLVALDERQVMIDLRFKDVVSVGGVPELAELVGARLASLLALAGFDSVTKVKLATDEQLLAVEGLGEKALATVRGKVV